MADNIQMVSSMLSDFVDDKVKGLIEKKEWMEKCTFTMVRTREQFTEVIDNLISKGLCALDLETTSLNTRVDSSGKSIARIVGVCLAESAYAGWYTPVGHEDKEFNLPYDFVVRELARLIKNCRCIFHNFKYDGQVLHNHGIEITDETTIEDTLLMAGVVDASVKERGLKKLSEVRLNRPMIDINKLLVKSGKQKIVKFDMVPPQIALYYGTSDALNTYALYELFKADLDKQDPDKKQGPWAVYGRIEKRCLFPVMAMERSLCRVDIKHFLGIKERLLLKKESLLKSIYSVAGREFDVNSPKQLGILLFEEMKVTYPEKEKTASGQYITEEGTLQKISDVPIVGLILDYRSIVKTIGTYVDNFLNNVDDDGYVKFQLNQLQADTGRFSASGGAGIKADGYCGVNCQNIPNADPDDAEAPDIRKGIIARDGYKIVSIDYSGEELRIAANLSREPKWLDEFLKGSADLHTMTARIIYGKNEVSKKERGKGKCVAKGTLIATKRGWLPIEKVKVGDSVVTSTGALKLVSSVHDMGIKPGKTITTKDGHRILCGCNHRFLTESGEWVKAEDIVPGMLLRTVSCEEMDPTDDKRIHFNFWDKGNDNRVSESLPYIEANQLWGKLLGYLLGDGHIHPYFAWMCCSDQDRDVKEDILVTARSLGLPCRAKVGLRPGAKKPLWTINIGSTIFSRFCKEIGFRGRRGKVFRVPWWIFESRKEVQAAFLRGLFETDGTVSVKASVSVCTKDFELAQDVVLLLASFGIRAHTVNKLSKKYNRMYYNVTIGRVGSEIFRDKIGFIGARKRANLDSFLSRERKAVDQGAWVSEVCSVESADNVELMDLTVEEDHTYVAQGLVTHNTLNFLTLYGGGAGGFAAQAKIPYEQAKKMIINFFRGYSVLKKWIDSEIKSSRKRGHSRTSFGRRRPLAEFYSATDEKIKAKGDRCAVNSCIQGCLQPHVRCLTTYGYIPISELSKTLKEHNDLRVWTGTSWEKFTVMNRGSCQTAQLELSNGMILDCDTRHEVLAPGKDGYEFVKFSDLKEGDDVCVSVPQLIEFGKYPEKCCFSGGEAPNSVDICVSKENDWNFIAYVLGTVVGDGYIRTGGRDAITITFGQEKIDRNYQNLKEGFKNIGLTLSSIKRSKGSVGVSYKASVSSKAFVSLFEYLGYHGRDARSKRVPEFIFRAPLAMRVAFLRGYHDTDGCKKERNGYCFHTPNLELLRDIQCISWTLGLASTLRPNADGSNNLSWCDLSAVESVLGLKGRLRKRCTAGDVPLPKFLYQDIYKELKRDGRYVKNTSDKAMVCKLNKGKPVLLTTALALLQKYNCAAPLVYYTAKVSKKIVNEKVMDTYTLSVDSPLHRFDSSCIISKNTGADVIKIALYRVWKWIKDNGYDDDVHLLMPIHDEIVFEIKEDKLDFYIPELCEILKIKDLTDALGWPVPFDVDAEYGDSFHVDHDYWKERKAIGVTPKVSQPKVSEEKQTPVQEAPVKVQTEGVPSESTVSKNETTTAVMKAPVDPSSPTTSSGEFIHFTVTVREAAMASADKVRNKLEKAESEISSNEEIKDVRIKDRIDHRGVLVYPIEHLDHITLHQFETVIRILVNYGEELFIGPQCKVALVDKASGEVLYESTRKVSVDAFLALCFWLKI